MQNTNVIPAVIFIVALAAMTFGKLSGLALDAALFGAVASVMTITHVSLSSLTGLLPTAAAGTVTETKATTTVVGPQ